MSSPGSSLSDVLRDLAENRSDAPREADRSIVKPPADAPVDAQDAGGPPSNGRSRDGGAAPYRAETLRRPVTTGFDLKAFAVPVLLTVGLLLLIPAVWGTLLLAGFEVWASGREGAVTMAKAMLVCWPIALVLLGSAAFYAMQLRRERAAR